MGLARQLLRWHDGRLLLHVRGACVKSKAAGSTQPDAYASCITSDLVSNGKCVAGCTPSFSMVATSEDPALNLTADARWGQPGAVAPRPSSSICSE